MSSSLITLVVVGAVILLTRRARSQQRGMTTTNDSGVVDSPFSRGERMRPISITGLDVLISLVIIGPIVWRVDGHSPSSIASSIIGAVVGVGIGLARSQVMYVRRVDGTSNIVLRRSGLEYGLLLILIVARSFEATVSRSRSSVAHDVLAALISLALVESFARAGAIFWRFRRDGVAAAT